MFRKQVFFLVFLVVVSIGMLGLGYLIYPALNKHGAYGDAALVWVVDSRVPSYATGGWLSPGWCLRYPETTGLLNVVCVRRGESFITLPPATTLWFSPLGGVSQVDWDSQVVVFRYGSESIRGEAVMFP